MNKLHIYIDFDEVLVNSIQADLDILNKRYGTNFTPNQVKSWNFRDCFPQLGDDEIEDVFNDPRFFELLTWKNDAKTFLRYCHKLSRPITLVTKGNKENLSLKTDWLEEQGFGWLSYIGLSLDKSKGSIDMSDGILIDDNQDNLNESNARIKILYENYPNCEWNNNWNGLRVSYFSDLYCLLEHFVVGWDKTFK